MVNYQLGKIYKLTGNGCTYYGSTAQLYLSTRLAGHVKNFKAYLAGKHNYVTSFKCLENTRNYEITLIEAYPCNSRAELEARERYYIELNRGMCCNRRIPTRTKKEYYIDNVEKIKNYRMENSDRIKQLSDQYYKDNADRIKRQRMERYYRSKSIKPTKTTMKVSRKSLEN